MLFRSHLTGYEDAGVDQVIFVQQSGTNRHEHICESLELFAATLLPDMHAVDPATYIEFQPISASPGYDSRDGGEIAKLGKVCSATHDTSKVSFGSEAALFHSAGMPAIICGPGHIAQAHQPNEWVALQQLALCEAFMARLADHLCVA